MPDQPKGAPKKAIRVLLMEDKRRGFSIQIILDRSQQTEKYSSADFVHNAGIPTFIDAAHAITHNKVMVIDNDVVLTGSFNFTIAAENHNAENLLVIDDAALAARYAENWRNHLAHATPYAGHARVYRPSRHRR